MTRALVLVLAAAASGCFFKPDSPAGPGSGSGYGDSPHHLAAGGKHACFIDHAGVLYCWGDNAHGQLGSPSSTVYTPTPTPVVGANGPLIGWTDVAVGSDHTCGILGDVVICFGLNDHGQVQGAAATNKVDLPSANKPIRIFAGGAGTCAIDESHAIYCWGLVDTAAGDFGTATPVEPAGVIAPWSEVAIADDHACAVRADAGSVWCWGDNDQEQTGGTDTSHPLSAANAIGVMGGSYRVISVGTGTSCGATNNGSLACWGSLMPIGMPATSYMLLDDISTSQRDWTALAIDGEHTCGIASGSVHCFGDGADGELGYGDFDGNDPPGAPLLPGTTELAVGRQFTCAANSADVRCWGANVYGELGNGVVATARDPVKVDLGGNKATALAMGYGHSCALSQSGDVYCWGDNPDGQALPGGGRMIVNPAMAASGMDLLAAGGRTTCGHQQSTNTVKCWGSNTTSPTLSFAADALAAGGATVCAAGSFSHEVYCWGDVPADAVTTPHAITTPATTPSGVVVGDGYAGVIDTTSGVASLYEWGDNFALVMTPVPAASARHIATGTSAIVMSQGGQGHACAEDASQAITCWGYNASAQVTSPENDGQMNPTPVAGATWRSPPSIAVGGNHSCALDSGGTMYCWGDNSTFALGGNVAIDVIRQPSPVATAQTDGWDIIATGPDDTCAITPSGSVESAQVYCWGLNRYGEVGNGASFVNAPPTTPINLP